MVDEQDGLKMLLDIEEIKQLKARYFFTLDTKDWDGYRSVFADEIEIDNADGHRTMPSDELVRWVRKARSSVLSSHTGHDPIIEITGPDTATGIWAMSDELVFPPEHESADGVRDVQRGYGHFHERYRRIDGQWRITFMQMDRLWVWRAARDPLVEENA